MNKQELNEEQCWTIGSYLRSAATKFAEIEAECRKPESSQLARSLASTFEKQKDDANYLAGLFEQADSVTLESEESWKR